MNQLIPQPKDLKQLVAGNKTVRFTHFRKGELWYAADCGFEFPVPVDDTGDGEFKASDRAIFFMRYIRKHLAAIAQGREESAAAT
jgi:hypothetical protein